MGYNNTLGYPKTAVGTDIPSQSNWVEYPLTIGATTTPPTKGTVAFDKAYWKRDGDSIKIRYTYAQTGAGSAGSGNYLFPLPPGFTIDATRVRIGVSRQTSSILGTGYLYTGNESTIVVFPFDTKNLILGVPTSATAISTISDSAAALSNTSESIQFTAEMPVLEFAIR